MSESEKEKIQHPELKVKFNIIPKTLLNPFSQQFLRLQNGAGSSWRAGKVRHDPIVRKSRRKTLPDAAEESCNEFGKTQGWMNPDDGKFIRKVK